MTISGYCFYNSSFIIRRGIPHFWLLSLRLFRYDFFYYSRAVCLCRFYLNLFSSFCFFNLDPNDKRRATFPSSSFNPYKVDLRFWLLKKNTSMMQISASIHRNENAASVICAGDSIALVWEFALKQSRIAAVISFSFIPPLM